ncbi:TPA: lytic transglycosylase domain-containing protein [Escherichia coli]|nr:lytic transglycosylase domain-containing protein [Escherichia coli]
MAKAWKEVIASPQYQALSPDQQAAAQTQYFNEVVAPQAGEQAETARQQFFSAYPPSTAQPQQPQPGNALEEAGKGLLQAGVNVANIPAEVLDAVKSAGSWAAGKLGLGDGTYQPTQRIELPQNLQPQDEYAKIGAEIGPYLVPGVGAERTAAALGSVAGAGRAERLATQASNILAENAPGVLAQNSNKDDAGSLAGDLALGAAGSVAGRALVAGGSAAIRGARNLMGREVTEAAPAATEAVSRASLTPETQSAQMAPEYARAAQSGKEGRIAQVVNDIQPDQKVVEAMQRLDLNPDDMLEAYTSGNDAFKAVQIGLASQDESALAAVRRDSLSRISQRAAKIIDDAGAMPDRLAMDDAFKTRFNTAREALKSQEEQLYKPVQDAIPARQTVDAANTRGYLDGLADDLGGYQNLSPVEKRIYESVSPTSDKTGGMTYARLNQARSIVGAELRKSGTPFGSAEERNLAQLYSQLSNDRDAVAKAAGFGEQIKLANAITAQRKMMEGNVYSLLGKDLSGNVTVKAQSALNGLQSGDTKGFTQLMRTVPDKETCAQLVATGLRDMFRKGSRNEVDNNINGFVNFYADLKRKGTDRILHSELPPQTVRELEDYYTLARNVTSANRYYLATGKLNSFLEKFDKPGGFLDKLATHGKMATIATVLGHVPVAGPVLNTAIAAQMGARAATRKSGSAAVQEMMGSSAFKNLAAAARSKPGTAAQERIVADAETKIAKSSAWKEFYRTLPKAEKQKIARVGIIGWLSGDGDGVESNQQMKQVP